MLSPDLEVKHEPEMIPNLSEDLSLISEAQQGTRQAGASHLHNLQGIVHTLSSSPHKAPIFPTVSHTPWSSSPSFLSDPPVGHALFYLHAFTYILPYVWNSLPVCFSWPPPQHKPSFWKLSLPLEFTSGLLSWISCVSPLESQCPVFLLIPCYLYSFSRAAIANYHKLGNLRGIYSHSFWGWKSKIEVWMGPHSSWRFGEDRMLPHPSQLLVVSGNPWHSLTCGHISLLSAFMITGNSPLWVFLLSSLCVCLCVHTSFSL